jgi:hypothetical protein
MALRELPLRNDVEAFRYRVDLDGSTYGIFIGWNERDGRWMIYLSDSANNDIASSPLLMNTDLWTRFRLPNTPPGIMFLIDPTGGTEECGRNDLGSRCRLIYSEAE